MQSFIPRLAAATAIAFAAGAAFAEDKAPLVTVLTDANPQTQLMAMVLTTQAQAQGHAVRILLCGPGADIALKEAPASATTGQPPKGASPQGLLKMAMEKGAKAEVCAIYLPGKGAGPEVLMDGVTVAQPPEMAGTMAAEGATIWSF